MPDPRRWKSATFHSRHVPSAAPVSSMPPSSEQATAVTGARCSVSCEDSRRSGVVLDDAAVPPPAVWKKETPRLGPPKRTYLSGELGIMTAPTPTPAIFFFRPRCHRCCCCCW